jgi:hypothetical protein
MEFLLTCSNVESRFANANVRCPRAPQSSSSRRKGDPRTFFAPVTHHRRAPSFDLVSTGRRRRANVDCRRRRPLRSRCRTRSAHDIQGHPMGQWWRGPRRHAGGSGPPRARTRRMLGALAGKGRRGCRHAVVGRSDRRVGQRRCRRCAGRRCRLCSLQSDLRRRLGHHPHPGVGQERGHPVGPLSTPSAGPPA